MQMHKMPDGTMMPGKTHAAVADKTSVDMGMPEDKGMLYSKAEKIAKPNMTMMKEMRQVTYPNNNKMKALMQQYRKTGKIGTKTPKNAQHAQRIAAEMAVAELEG